MPDTEYAIVNADGVVRYSSLALAASLLSLEPVDVLAAIEEAGWCGAMWSGNPAVIVEADDWERGELVDDANAYLRQ